MWASELSGMQRETLDLLSNGPSSFGALYRSTLQPPSLAVPGVAAAFEEVVSLAQDGIVEAAVMGPNGELRPFEHPDGGWLLAGYVAWLDGRDPSTIPVGETAVDEVGLWLCLTEQGRALWESLSDG